MWSLECLNFWNEEILESSQFFLLLLITFNHLILLNWSTLHFIRFEVNMAVVDRWRRETSRWRPFTNLGKSRKLAVEAVSPTASRLINSASRLLKKITFWSPSLKIWSQATSRLFLYQESTPEEFQTLTQFCIISCLRPRVDSSCPTSRLLKKNIFTHFLWSQATSHLFHYWESTPEELLHKSQFCKKSSSG